jgi:type 1 glutamine amidotransferase
MITSNLDNWEMINETYVMQCPDKSSNILITTKHPNSMKAIAWTRKYKNSRVFCCQLGHDYQAYNHPKFRRLLHQGIHWLAQGK